MFNNLKLPDSIDNATKNLTDKPTAQIGTTIADIFYLVFSPISLQVEKRKLKYQQDLELYRQTLEGKVNAIPKEKQIEPDMQIAATALEDSKYCIGSEILREMFSELIAKSMNSDYENNIHQSFSSILKQMSPFDAQLFMQFKNNYTLPCVNLNLTLREGEITLLNYWFSPFENMDTINKTSVSLTSLKRLGLIEIPEGRHLTNKALYDAFYKSPVFSTAKNVLEKLKSNANSYIEHDDNGYASYFHLSLLFLINNQEAKNTSLTLQEKVVRLTPLGKQFIKVVSH